MQAIAGAREGRVSGGQLTPPPLKLGAKVGNLFLWQADLYVYHAINCFIDSNCEKSYSEVCCSVKTSKPKYALVFSK